MASTLLLDGFLGLAIAGIYVYIGRTLARRPVEGEARRASLLFAGWWHALAVLTVIGSGTRALAAAGLLTFPLYEAAIYVTLVPLCFALFALLYYLVYLFTGRSTFLVPLAVIYSAFYVFLVGYVASLQPIGFIAGDWTLKLEYANPPEGGVHSTLILALVVPHIVGALAYMRLIFTLKDRTARYRVALVSGSILAWFGSSLLASELDLGDWYWWPLASRAIALVAALTILAAYRPPVWLQRRFRVASLETDAAPA